MRDFTITVTEKDIIYHAYKQDIKISDKDIQTILELLEVNIRDYITSEIVYTVLDFDENREVFK